MLANLREFSNQGDTTGNYSKPITIEAGRGHFLPSHELGHPAVP